VPVRWIAQLVDLGRRDAHSVWVIGTAVRFSEDRNVRSGPACGKPDPSDVAIAELSDRLRTPLTSIVGQVELLLTGELGVLVNGQRDAIETIRRSGERLFELIQEAEARVARHYPAQ
jgi:hypothetical protein